MFTRLRRWFTRPKNPAGHVYYVRLNTPQGTFYKLGYTSKATLTERMAYGGSGDEKLIDRELLFRFREDAWDVEQTLLDHFHKHRAFGKFSNDPLMPLSGRGQSELFARDILGLDEDLYRLSDKERREIEGDLGKAGDGCLFVLLGIVLIPFTLGLSLFFIIGGLFDALEYGKRSGKVDGRPKHPPKIQQLLNELVHTRPTASEA